MATCGSPGCPICSHWASAAARPVEPTVLPVEHTAQAVRGYRAWRVAYAQNSINGERLSVLPGLYARAAREFWTHPVTHAICSDTLIDPFCGRNGRSHVVPVRECHCGLYAWHRPESVEDDALYARFGDNRRPDVVGVVEGAGRVMWGRRGWRAEKARILAVWAREPAVAEMIRATYPGVELVEDEEALAKRWPPEVLPEAEQLVKELKATVNPWLQQGPPSYGLMQTLGSTFRAYGGYLPTAAPQKNDDTGALAGLKAQEAALDKQMKELAADNAPYPGVPKNRAGETPESIVLDETHLWQNVRDGFNKAVDALAEKTDPESTDDPS